MAAHEMLSSPPRLTIFFMVVAAVIIHSKEGHSES
jgi:hypothetical protein